MIVTCTTSGGGILRPEALKSGCVICDVAVPHDVCREVAQLRPDVLVLEGGVVEAPGEARFNFDFGFPEGICLACMAETMTLALEGRFEDFSIGRGLEMEKVEEIQRLATRHGFRLAGFRAFDEPITTERIEGSGSWPETPEEPAGVSSETIVMIGSRTETTRSRSPSWNPSGSAGWERMATCAAPHPGRPDGTVDAIGWAADVYL